MKNPISFFLLVAMLLWLNSCMSDQASNKGNRVSTPAAQENTNPPIAGKPTSAPAEEAKPQAASEAKSVSAEAAKFTARQDSPPQEKPPRKDSAALAAPLLAFNDSPNLQDEPAAKIKGDGLDELSGIAPAQHEGEYWGHNDRGNDAEIFRFDRFGKILQKTVLKNEKNDDWEAMLRGGDGFLYIGGFGDNDEKKERLHIYQLKEPEPGVKKTNEARTYTFEYSDGKAHNCEAFFPLNGRFYLITKEKKDQPILFRLESLKEQKTNTAEKIGKMEIYGEVTDAAYSPSHNLLAVLTYTDIFFFSVKEEKNLLNPPVHRIGIDYERCEGLCFDKENLVLCNEPGKLWIVPLSRFLKTNY